jgi:hypothetical protein
MDFGPHYGPASLPHEGSATARALTVEAGASLAELMNRMGRSSTRAARVYLHAREERDRGMVKSCGRRVLIDHAATLVLASSGRSMSTPFSNLAPARTRATRCGPLT